MKCKRQVPRPWLSLAASKEPADHRAEAGYFPRHAPAQEEAMAVVVETKAGRNPQRPAGGIFQARTGARYCEVSRRPKLYRSPRPPYISTPPMKFCGQKVQRFAEAFKASGRLAPRA